MKKRINFKSIFVFGLVVALSSCDKKNEQVTPTQEPEQSALNLPPLNVAKGPVIEFAEPETAANGRVAAEVQMTRVDGRVLSAGGWQNVFTTANSGWDLSATYRGQIYNYGGGTVDLYVYNNINNNWVYLGGTSGSGNPKSFTFKMRAGQQHFFWAYCSAGSNVRFDAALYKIANDSGNGSGAASNVTFNKSLVSGTNYRHFCQLNGALFPGYACIPTSYMIARGIVYGNRSVSKDELTRISRGMGLQSWGTSITNASNFAKSDIGSCNPSVQANANVSWAKTYIRDAINSNIPLIAVTNLRTQHIVVTVGLKLTNSDDTSEVYYIDPYNRNAGVSTIKLSSFLASMRAASSYGLHNFLRIGC